MKTYVLYNPKSGNGTGGNKLHSLKEILNGIELNYLDITSIDLERFFAGLERDSEVILCGGDGTLNHFINDIDTDKIINNIYFYPAGSGNDFWHDVAGGNGDKPLLINDYIRNLPTVTINGKNYRFINGVGYGIDGYCCEEGDRLRETTDKPINYTSIAIKGLLFAYKPTNAEITIDGKTYNFKKVWLAPAMNGRFYGGGMMATPNQERISNDKKLTVLLMSGTGKLATLMAFPKIFTGEHITHKYVTVLTGKEITVKFDRPVAAQIDGETILGVTEYTAKA